MPVKQAGDSHCENGKELNSHRRQKMEQDNQIRPSFNISVIQTGILQLPEEDKKSCNK